MDYAIIRLGGKQYRVREGETLVVDRLRTDEGKSFSPDVLLGDSGVTVTAKVIAHERGPKILIGKYRKRTGYKRHTGFRAATSRVEISLGGTKRAAGEEGRDRSEGPRLRRRPSQAAAAAPADDHVKGMPNGYEDMTVAQVSEAPRPGTGRCSKQRSSTSRRTRRARARSPHSSRP